MWNVFLLVCLVLYTVMQMFYANRLLTQLEDGAGWKQLVITTCFLVVYSAMWSLALTALIFWR